MDTNQETQIKDLVVWGGLYKVKHMRWVDKSWQRYNDQNYNLAVPCMRKDGSVWMQDTYQIKYPTIKKNESKTLAAMERIFSFEDPEYGDLAICYSCSEYYCKGNEKITSADMLNDYELICDLHDYRPLDHSEDYRDYDSKDVISGVKLYNEHGYSWTYGSVGVKLIKKDAQPVMLNQLIAAMSDTSSELKQPDGQTYGRLEKMQSIYEKMLSKGIVIPRRQEVRYQNLLWLENRLNEMKQEIKEYMEEHKYRDSYKFESEDLYLKDIHPDMERYLQESCYCPHEIYDVRRFSYELFYETNKCKLIDKSETMIAVISRASDSSKPEILVFWYDDIERPGQIVAAQRIDATENNIKIVKGIVHNQKDKFMKLDSFKNETCEEIEEMFDRVLS